jgi:Inositol hexakisphosphate
VDDTTLIFDSVREQGLPNHFRTSTGPYATAAATPPSRLGLDGLMASGSEQPSLAELAGVIRQFGKNVMVVDLRQESHALLSEHPVSWYGTKNWANRGKSRAEVEADERSRIAALSKARSAVVARVYAKDSEGRLCSVRTEETAYLLAQSEESAACSLGLGYFRIPVSDHSRPLDADVNCFISLIRGLAPGTWLHFHCHAGDGRTTTFMLLYDMLRNAGNLGLEELAARQHLLGGVDVLHTPHTGWKEPLYKARVSFISRFYEYARIKDFKTVSWSEYFTGFE